MKSTTRAKSASPPEERVLRLWGADPDGPDADAFERDALAWLRTTEARASTCYAAVYRRDEGWSGAGQAPLFLMVREERLSIATEARASEPPTAGAGRHSLGVYRPLEPPDEWTAPGGQGLLYVRVDVEPAFLDPFVDWYVGEHVPAIVSAPGMLGARRYENVALEGGLAPPGEHRFCTLYDMEAADVVGRAGTLEASDRGACPAGLAPHRRAHNAAYRRCG